MKNGEDPEYDVISENSKYCKNLKLYACEKAGFARNFEKTRKPLSGWEHKVWLRRLKAKV
jgi:hypothetical protein